MSLLNILLLGPAQGEGDTMTTVLMLGAIMLVFYFFMLRPQMQKQKKQKNFKESVKKGDKVVTIGGIHGKIAEIRESVFIIDIEQGAKMKIEKSAVSMDYTDQNQKSKAVPEKKSDEKKSDEKKSDEKKSDEKKKK